MQKIDFTNYLETVVEKLKSKEITDKFNAGFAQPSVPFDYSTINPLLFLSKSNYDQIKNNFGISEILNSLGASEIYSESNLSYLTTVLRQVKAESILINPKPISLFNFHNTLVKMLSLAESTLKKPFLYTYNKNEFDDGILIFQILIDGDGLETEKYIKILSSLDELIRTISKVIETNEEKSEIVLLDSGSDTNLGIKTGIETAKSLFLIFKEIWEYITNFKLYKHKQRSQALLDSLSIRTEIQKKIDEGILTEEEGKEYLHVIKTRTDTLIGLKVLPKQIVAESNEIGNRKLLTEFEGIKLLTEGNSEINEL